MGLCFRFVLKTVLIPQGCFRYCWAVLTQSQGLCCLSRHPTSEEAGGAQGVGRGPGQDSWPQLTKGIFHTVWCHTRYKTGEACQEAGSLLGNRVSIRFWFFSPQVVSNCICASLFFIFIFLYIKILLNCLYLNPRVGFFWVFFFILFPIPLWGRRVSKWLPGA